MTNQTNTDNGAPHRPVMLAEVLDTLAPVDGGIYVDGTFGAGGYTRGVLDQANCQVFAIDRDPNAIRDGAEMVAASKGRLVLSEGRFSELDQILDAHGIDFVDGVVLDIGVSSMQLDQAERGFSFSKDGPLDMRMSQEGLSAADVVNNFSENQLQRIIAIFGEERRARAIARAIHKARQEQPFMRTSELAALIERVIGHPGGKGKGKTIHPATRTFQALRIFVNAELDELITGLAAAERKLKPGGRLVVVTFHSLEDRIVKRFFKKRSGSVANPSRHMPEAAPRDAPSFKMLVRGGITAGEDEIAINPRARSARLRAAVRTDAAPMPLDDKELLQGHPGGIE